MKRIFLAPRSNETSYKNFLSTINDGVNPELVYPFLAEEEKGALKGHKRFYIWGNLESKKPSWEQMQLGDIILFYAHGSFVYSGECLFKKFSDELGSALWPPATENKGAHWNCIFFVHNLQP